MGICVRKKLGKEGTIKGQAPVWEVGEVASGFESPDYVCKHRFR